MNTIVIAFANHKGGVGKTTTVASLAAMLATQGRRVLMVDLDAQCSLTETFIDFLPEKTIWDALTGPKTNHALDDLIIPGTEFSTPILDLDLIAASPELSEIETTLASRINREGTLLKVFRSLGVEEKYDYVLLDCPPSLETMTVNALTACSRLIVPTTPEMYPVNGLRKLEDKCEEIADSLNPGLRIDGIVVTRYNPTKNLYLSIDEALRRHYGNTVFTTRIRDNVRLAECPGVRKNIFDYAPNSNGAKDYQALAREVIQRFENQ